ncbi:ATP-dependent zinc metalloprotease FTSH 12, chloroplastic-like [Hibiscus syriacus]|uniref:ATP-dependent zinc metalloprotease FTSH 12, chloroplastic-like n=1 Tax=Hibiscus syriacus TaxID=106335 RepID=UPI0019241A85|nr:ATP-dependent zinc metalloprotease FTSH 12, chloroplastic-like [Hibiscus syriacus]
METGFDLDEENVRIGLLVGRVNQGLRKGEGEFNRFRTKLLPEFDSWNQWERWKDFKNWDLKGITALVLYIFVAIISCQRLYAVVRAPLRDRERKQLTEA